MTEVIRNRDGIAIQTSRNLAGIRKYVSNHLIKWLDICPIGENGSGGQLSILFDDGASFQTNFADFGVLKNFVRNWRNVYGAPLLSGGVDCGEVDYHNEKLCDIVKPKLKTFDIREGDGNNGCQSRGTIEASDAFEAIRKASRKGMIRKPYDVVLKNDIDGDNEHAYTQSWVAPIWGDCCRWIAEAHLVD